MPAKNPYPHEQFSGAISSMATGLGSLQERIADALNYRICHVKESDIPVAARYDLYSMMEEIAKVEPKGDEGQNNAWALGLSDDGAIKWAGKIFEIYDIITNDYLGS